MADSAHAESALCYLYSACFRIGPSDFCLRLLAHHAHDFVFRDFVQYGFMTEPELKLSPGIGFHLTDQGEWVPEEIPQDVLDSATVSGHITIHGYRSTVFETPDKDQWAQKSPVIPPKMSSTFSEGSDAMNTVASRVAARWLEAKGRKRDVTSIVKKIMDRPGKDKDYEKEIVAYGRKVRKAIPKIEAMFDKFVQDLAKVVDALGEASYDKVTEHHAVAVRQQFDKSLSTVQVAANSLIRNLQKKADEWAPE